MKTKTFTGWHMTTILVAFFGIVIAVNLIMARFAVGTFGGTVVDNSYVASQKFNGWIDEANQQKRLGWTVKSSLNDDRHVLVSATMNDAPLAGAIVSATAHHPLGSQPARNVRFSPTADGRYVSETPLPAGRWQVKLTVTRGGETLRSIESFR